MNEDNGLMWAHMFQQPERRVIKTSGRPLGSCVINNTGDASSELRVSRESSPAVKPPQGPAGKSQLPDKYVIILLNN